jgi:predicted transglutaminase-like cysteine proteinase
MILVSSRVLRVVALVAAMIAFALPSAGVAGPTQARTPIDVAHGGSEPFGSATLLPAGGGVLGKWLAVWRQWNDEKQVLTRCRDDRTQCTDPAALAFLAIVDNAKALKGRAQLGDINRAINLAIRPVSDLAASGSIDVWSSPLATLTSRSGDCEDYAILKFVALLEAGVSSDDLRLLIVRDSARAEDHAVVVARHEDKWLVLDNRRLVMLADTQLANYSPLLQLDGAGARRYFDTVLASIEPDSAPPSMVEPSALAP